MQILKHKKLSFLIKTCICHQKVVILQRKINEHLISYHKKGKSIVFLKSEIDEWLRNGKRKSMGDLEKEAQAFVNS